MKRFTIIYLLLLCLSGSAYTQALTPPEYPGGKRAFSEFLSKNLKWPDLVSSLTHGVVIVGFVVEKDGSLTHIRVTKSLSPAFDKEALRVITLSRKWVPAIQNEKNIKSIYTVPIEFDIKETTAAVTGVSVTLRNADVTIDEPVGDAPNNDPPDKIYTSVQKIPEFPGGIVKFQEYVNEGLKKEKLTSEDSGLVIVSFIAERDGSLTDIKVVRSVSATCDAIAIKLLKNSPKWSPGIAFGKPVRVLFSVPIRFKPNN